MSSVDSELEVSLMVGKLEKGRQKNWQEKRILNGRKRLGGETALRAVVELLSFGISEVWLGRALENNPCSTSLKRSLERQSRCLNRFLCCH